MLHKALDALQMDWRSDQLRVVLTHDVPTRAMLDSLQGAGKLAIVDTEGQFVWNGEWSVRYTTLRLLCKLCYHGCGLIPEHLPTACARVEALKTHDFNVEAVRLAAAIVRAMKVNQYKAMVEWSQLQQVQQQQQAEKLHQLERTPSQRKKEDAAASGPLDQATTSMGTQNSHREQKQQRHRGTREEAYTCYEGWIGHSLDPIGCLFDTLSEVCLTPEERRSNPHHLDPVIHLNSTSSSSTEENKTFSSSTTTTSSSTSSTSASSSASSLPRYRPAPTFRAGASPPGCEPYLLLALEAALLGLGQQRLMPAGLYSQEKACQQEERLVSRLHDVELNAERVSVLRARAVALLEAGPSSALGCGAHPESAPAMLLAKYLFVSLLPHDADLAFRVGLRAMRLPIQDVGVTAVNPRIQPRWFTLGHVEGQQCALASVMMGAAKGEGRIRSIVRISR